MEYYYDRTQLIYIVILPDRGRVCGTLYMFPGPRSSPRYFGSCSHKGSRPRRSAEAPGRARRTHQCESWTSPVSPGSPSPTVSLFWRGLERQYLPAKAQHPPRITWEKHGDRCQTSSFALCDDSWCILIWEIKLWGKLESVIWSYIFNYTQKMKLKSRAQEKQPTTDVNNYKEMCL